MLQKLLFKMPHAFRSRVSGQRILECRFAVFLLAGTLAVFEVSVEASSPGRAGDRPTEESVDFKRPGEGGMHNTAAESHCGDQSMFVMCSLPLL